MAPRSLGRRSWRREKAAGSGGVLMGTLPLDAEYRGADQTATVVRCAILRGHRFQDVPGGRCEIVKDEPVRFEAVGEGMAGAHEDVAAATGVSARQSVADRI